MWVKKRSLIPCFIYWRLESIRNVMMSFEKSNTSPGYSARYEKCGRRCQTYLYVFRVEVDGWLIIIFKRGHLVSLATGDYVEVNRGNTHRSKAGVIATLKFKNTSVMGGPNLEIFKFSLYLFVPIVALIHFGNPEWYREKVVPVSVSSPFCCDACSNEFPNSIETNFSLRWTERLR